VTLLIAFVLSSAVQSPSQPAVKPPLLDQIACAPMGLPAPPLAVLRVLGGYVHGRLMFAPGDALIVNAGTGQGLQPGQQYFVRRLVHDASTKQPKIGALYGVHTAGWITIVDVKDTMAVATVTHACDGILEGDYLEPYVEPALPSPALTGSPDYAHPGRIVLADERRQSGYPGLVMLVDRGTDHGVTPGQTLTVYRETLGGQGPLLDLGRATVLSASAQSALVRIDSSREAIFVGDLVAIHRITQ
jgi:hypothetical protein